MICVYTCTCIIYKIKHSSLQIASASTSSPITTTSTTTADTDKKEKVHIYTHTPVHVYNCQIVYIRTSLPLFHCVCVCVCVCLSSHSPFLHTSVPVSLPFFPSFPSSLSLSLSFPPLQRPFSLQSKKGDFALSDSKEKHVKDLISKWSSFKES